MTPFPRLAEPLRVGSLILRNRVVFAAHLTNFAEDNAPSDRHAAYYAARAAGGAGLVVTEEFTVLPDDHPYERSIAGWSPRVDAGSRRLTDAVHAAGAPVLAQLNHNGGQASGLYSRGPVHSASAIADPMFREVPVALDDAGLARVVAGFADTARRCVANGFDGVEVQCSQASLLHASLAPSTNRRADGYGDDLPGRSRLLLEVVAAVRLALGAAPVLGVRLGADDPTRGGVALDDVVAVGRALDATRSVDYVSTTTGVATSSLHRIEASMATAPGHALPVARALRAAIGIPVVGVGRLVEPHRAERALVDGDCDLVAVVRGQVADPDFAGKALTGRRVRRCLGCNQDCIGRVGINADLRCVVNPLVGREAEPLPAPRVPDGVDAHVVVVGAGPAGLSTSAHAAARGYRVTVLEASRGVGGQLAIAARGPHRGELAHLTEDLLDECHAAGVDVRLRCTADVALVRELQPDAVVVATGARPRTPSWAGGRHAVDAASVLAGAPVPTGRVVVLDELGSAAATSVAELLAGRGADVEILTPGMVVGQDLGLTLDLPGWKQRAAELGIRESTEQVVISVAGAGGAGGALTARGRAEVVLTTMEHPTGRRHERSCDAVVVATHLEADDQLWSALREALPPDVPVLRVGDCVAPRQAGDAVRDGWTVAMTL